MDERRRVWRLYGWYSALMMCGSCVGAVTWAAWMQFIVNSARDRGDTTLSRSQASFFGGLGLRWRSTFSVTYAVEFLILSAAKLMVHNRMPALPFVH